MSLLFFLQKLGFFFVVLWVDEYKVPNVFIISWAYILNINLHFASLKYTFLLHNHRQGINFNVNWIINLLSRLGFGVVNPFVQLDCWKQAMSISLFLLLYSFDEKLMQWFKFSFALIFMIVRNIEINRIIKWYPCYAQDKF